MSLENVRYDAFISYRHCELDSFISENLHKKLESYRMPASVAKKLSPSKRKIERVFRDEAELPLSQNLSDPITVALDNSEFLIVICTPRLRQSQWCLKEIETFVATHDREHVLLVLAEGEPDESFPEILLHDERVVKDANGNDVTVVLEREPLAADCRADTNRQRLKKLDNVVLKLCAAMFGLNYDDLRQRHRQRLLQRRIALASLAFAIVAAFAITCLFFLVRISRQNKVIADKYAGAMAEASEDLLAEGLLKDSLYSVRSTLPDDPSSDHNAGAYHALCAALAPYEISNCYYPAYDIEIPRSVETIEMSEDKPVILVNAGGYSDVMDIKTGNTLISIENGFASLYADGLMYINNGGQAVYATIPNGDETIVCDDAVVLYVSETTDSVVIFTNEGLRILRGDKVSDIIEIDEAWADEMPDVEGFTFSEDGRYAAFAFTVMDGIHAGVIDIDGGTCHMLPEAVDGEYPAAATDGEVLYLYYEEDSHIADASAVIVSLDIDTGIVLSQRDLSGIGFYNMTAGKNGLLVVSDSISYVLDDELKDICVITGYAESVCEFAYGGGYVLMDRMGQMHTAQVFSTDETCFELYGNNGTKRIVHCSRDDRNDRFLICRSDTGRACIYERRGIASPEEVPADAEKIEYPEKEPDTDELDIDSKIVLYSMASDDGKYIASLTSKGELRIFDAASKKEVKTVYDSDIVLINNGFIYLEGADSYIIGNRIFDSEFNMTGDLPAGAIAAVGADKKSVYILSRFEEGIAYRITLIPYEDMIKRADELLEGYMPSDYIKSRYSIN